MNRSPKTRPTSLYSVQTTSTSSSAATLSTYSPLSATPISPIMARRELATKDNQYLGLHAAAASGNLGLVKFALDHGAPIDAVLNGFLPLQMACVSDSNLPVVMFLIQRGADVNARRWSRRQTGDRSSLPAPGAIGSTCLHIAAAHNSVRCVDLLLRCGAIVDLTDKYGSTPLSVAQAQNYTEIAEMLMTYDKLQKNPEVAVDDDLSDEESHLSPPNSGRRPSTISLGRRPSLPSLVETGRAMGSISSASSESSACSFSSESTLSTAPSSILTPSLKSSSTPLDGQEHGRRSLNLQRPKSVTLPIASEPFTLPPFLVEPPPPSSTRFFNQADSGADYVARNSSESKRPRPPPLKIGGDFEYERSTELMGGVNTLPTPPSSPISGPYNPFHPTASMPSLIPREEDFTLPPTSYRNRPFMKKRWSDNRSAPPPAPLKLSLTRSNSSGSQKDRPIFNTVLNLNLRPTLHRNDSGSLSIISTSSYSISATPPPSPTSAYMAPLPKIRRRWLSLRGKSEDKEDNGRVSMEAVRRSVDFARAAIAMEKKEKKERRRRRAKNKVGQVVEKIKSFFKR